jgi:hypothetical protein
LNADDMSNRTGTSMGTGSRTVPVHNSSLALRPATTLLPGVSSYSIEAALARSGRGILGGFRAARRDNEIADLVHEVRKGAVRLMGACALIVTASETGHRALDRIEAVGVGFIHNAQTAGGQEHHLALMQEMQAEVAPTVMRVLRRNIDCVLG